MDYFSENINRNVAKIYPSKDFLLKKLASSSKLRIYLGIDPSSPRIHLGNAVALWKLREFQNLGHKVILLIGDFTGMIGDPTGRDLLRKPLSRDQVVENSQSYKTQASKILSFSGKNPAEIAYNGEWLSKLNFEEVVKLAGHFTVGQMLERDMFQKRLTDGRPIGLHEFLYPVMQGYDSVALDVDMEIGGTDQTFNMLIGRSLSKDLKNKEKIILTIPLLEGNDGRKMSKSYLNSIDITEVPNEMFGKIMALSDRLILKYFELCTDISLQDLKAVEKRLKKENPIGIKKELAKRIVERYYKTSQAQEAQAEFERTVQKKELPKEIEEIQISKKVLPKPYLFFLMEVGLCTSNSQAIRLAAQGGVYFDEEKISNLKEEFNTANERVIVRAGKRNLKAVKFV